MKMRDTIANDPNVRDLFLARYAWLMRWAMHFAQNDLSLAHDLVQEVFLRFSQANLTVSMIRDPEALLYTYLRYVHLTHLRDVRRHSFASLSGDELEALSILSANTKEVDPVETQNTLRRIAAYAAWRKRTSKSASILALRFFHGYLPEEIRRITLLSREAVDEGIFKARQEVKHYLEDPSSLRKVLHGGPPEIFPSRFPVSTDDFTVELRNRIFEARHDHCMPRRRLVERYLSVPKEAIHRDLLAHIVSCRVCLDIAEHVFDVGSGTDGKPGRRAETKVPEAITDRKFNSTETSIDKSLGYTTRKLKQIYEHSPGTLIVSVNGQVLASRDAYGAINCLKVEVLDQRGIQFVEVLNEYGVCLFSWAVEAEPPHTLPSCTRTVEFSNGRTMQVELHFTGSSPIIEVNYHNPSRQPARVAYSAPVTPEEGYEIEKGISRRRKLALWLSPVLAPWEWLNKQFHPLIVVPVAFVLVAAVFLAARLRGVPHVTPDQLIHHAVESDARGTNSAEPGVSVQKVRIQTRTASIERTLYHDARGKRRLRKLDADAGTTELRHKLEGAGIGWDAPLSAASFQDWHEHQTVVGEVVRSASNHLLTLTTRVKDSNVASETLTVRDTDFHPVFRSVEFSDRETVEVAELNYDVLPWSSVNQDLFEPALSGASLGDVRRNSPPSLHSVVLPTEAQLDLAELQAMVVVNGISADSGKRISIIRGQSEIVVRGIVRDAGQRSDLTTKLRTVPHTVILLTTMDEMQQRPESLSNSAKVEMSSVVAEASPLEQYLIDRGKTREFASDIADRMFTDSGALLRASKALGALNEQFGHKDLEPSAMGSYDSLRDSYREEIVAAIKDQGEALSRIGVDAEHANTSDFASVDPLITIERSSNLVRQLLVNNSGKELDHVPDLLAQLAQSTAYLRVLSAEPGLVSIEARAADRINQQLHP